MSDLALPTAEVFEPLLQPSRYKGAWGGRGSGKSHFFAEMLIEDSLREPGECAGAGLLSVCIRQVQKSLKQSSKRLIEAKLRQMGLGERHGFKVFNEVIQTPGNGVITFQGMQDHTADSIKSIEGFKRAWWEEAQGATAFSLSLLRPTIRTPGSEMWFSWNPRRKLDPVDRMLRGTQLPTGSTVVRANWQHNPWFTPELEQERLDCLRMEADQYAHIWDGDYVTAVSGAYYARGLALAKEQGRISRASIDPLMTLRAYWDIGGTGAKADACAIWIVQFIGREVRVLRYYEAIGQPLATHVNWLRRNGFSQASCVLPHDGAAHDKVYAVSYEGELRKAGFEVKVVPNMGAGAAMTRIEAGRRLFPSIWFNNALVRDLSEGAEAEEADATEAGRDALGWYHEKRDESRNIGFGPAHDWASHGADAFGLMAVDYLGTDHSEPDMSALDDYTTGY